MTTLAEFRLVPIEELAVSPRVKNTLSALDIWTLGDVEKVTASQLLRIPNFGRVSLAQLREVMAYCGLYLKPEDDRPIHCQPGTNQAFMLRQLDVLHKMLDREERDAEKVMETLIDLFRNQGWIIRQWERTDEGERAAHPQDPPAPEQLAD